MAVTPHENAQTRHELGVLFVHGIGQQVRGGTLVQFGDPICEWLSRWGGSDFTLDKVDLNPGEGAPANAEVRSGNADWLFAECHWADAFHEPSFRDLMKWAFVGIPWVLGAHFNTQITLGMLCWKTKHFRRAIVRFLRAIGSSVAGAVFVALVAALFPILFVFAAIPVLRSVFVSVQRLLAAVLGDSYLFVESHLQQAAIVSRFRRDFAWLLKRSRRVAVVAHSQGAAVAYFGCKGWVPDDPAARPDAPVTLVTLGSGLSKLQVLRGARALRWDHEHGGLYAWVAPAGLILMAGSAYALPGADWGGFALGLVLLALGALNLLAGSMVTIGAPTRLSEANGGLLETMEWTDVTATRDLVSNTSIAEFLETGETPAQIQRLLGLARLPTTVRIVENFRARLGDHVTYLKNTDGLLPIVVGALLRAAGSTLPHKNGRHAWTMPERDAATVDRLTRSAARRKWRVRWRASTTVAWFWISLALLARRAGSFPADFIGGLQQRLEAMDPGVTAFALAPISRVVLAFPSSLTGVVSIGLLTILVLLVLRALWAAWDVSDRWRFFDGADYTLSPEFWGFAAIAIVSLEALALLALGWPFIPNLLAMGMAGFGAMVEAIIGFSRDSRRTGALLSEADKRGMLAIGRFGATALILWPLFAGLTHFGLDAGLVEWLQLPSVSQDPSQFWIGLLVGLPIWACFWMFGRAAVRRLRVWSVSGPGSATSAPDAATPLLT